MAVLAVCEKSPRHCELNHEIGNRNNAEDDSDRGF